MPLNIIKYIYINLHYNKMTLNSTPRIVTFQEISRLQLEELVFDRVIQRDIHLTLYNATRDISLENPKNGILYNPNLIIRLHYSYCPGHIDTALTFRIDDPERLYFFMPDWPSFRDNVLNSENTLPSGIVDEDIYDPLRLEFRLKPGDVDAVLFGGDRKVDASTVRKVMQYVNGLVANHPTPDIPFTKPLYAVDSFGHVQLLDSVANKWDYCSELVRIPSLTRRAIRNIGFSFEAVKEVISLKN